LATFTITGENASTNFSVFSVEGRRCSSPNNNHYG
jgi:hypothetical protein